MNDGGTGPLEFRGLAKRDAVASAPDESGPVRSAPGQSPEDEQAAKASVSANSVGRYEVLSVIGRGGMGTVYLCRLRAEGGFRRLFAMKLLHRHLSRDDSAAQRFLEEAHLAGRTHHPNVVGVVDAGFWRKQPYLVMEYVEGVSLRELLLANGRSRPPSLLLPILIDALAGLHVTHGLVDDDGHSLGVVHGDVSPENLLIGVDGITRISDFGVARTVADRSKNRTVFGKAPYIAPERYLGTAIDWRSDVFSMGVVLYEALTGINPFEAPTSEEAMKRVCSRAVPAPSRVGLHPSPQLDRACLKALERDPARRYASAEQMLADLRAIALRERWLAPATEIAGWVQSTAGAELARRRQLVLETASESGPRVTLAAFPANDPPGLAELPAEPSAIHTLATASSQVEGSEKIPHGARSSGRVALRMLVIAASVAAVAITAAGLIWPEEIYLALGLKTAGVSSPDRTFTPEEPVRAPAQDPPPKPAVTPAEAPVSP